MCMHALEEGRIQITVYSRESQETDSLTIQIRKGKGFEDHRISIPAGFHVPGDPCSLKIETEGKIRLCRFFFR